MAYVIQQLINIYTGYFHRQLSCTLSLMNLSLCIHIFNICLATICLQAPIVVITINWSNPTVSYSFIDRAISLAIIAGSILCSLQALFKLYNHYLQPPLATRYPPLGYKPLHRGQGCSAHSSLIT